MQRHKFVDFVKNEIERKHISQNELASISGVDRGSISKWFCATRNPRLFMIEAVLNALGYELRIVKRYGKRTEKTNLQ